MRVAVESRIPDLIGTSTEGLSVLELADKTGIEVNKLRKIMRALATRHCFRQGARMNLLWPKISFKLTNRLASYS